MIEGGLGSMLLKMLAQRCRRVLGSLPLLMIEWCWDCPLYLGTQHRCWPFSGVSELTRSP